MGDSKAFAAAYKMAGNAASDEIVKLRSEIARLRALGLEACDLIDSGDAYCSDCDRGQRADAIRKELTR